MLNKTNYFKMTKEKLYNPDKCSSFEMQFGFEQPLKYIPNKRKQIRYENKRYSQSSVITETSFKR